MVWYDSGGLFILCLKCIVQKCCVSGCEAPSVLFLNSTMKINSPEFSNFAFEYFLL